VTSLALAPSPTTSELVHAQLESLRLRLLVGDASFDEAVSVRDQAESLRAYAASARMGLQVANSAIELKLRAERRCGCILNGMIAAAGPVTAGARCGRPAHVRNVLPRRTLAELGLSGKESSRMQLLSKLGDAEFELRVSAAKEAGRQLSSASFLRAAAQYVRVPGGRQTTPAARLLSRALELLRNVRVVSTPREVKLAREVVQIGASWSTVLNPPPPPPPPPVPTAVVREVSCLRCGRTQPASKPARCPHCRGAWMQA
jgi:hypothetical protein